MVLHKQEGEGLGISISGGAEFQMPIFVSAIREGTAASEGDGLFVGDEIISVRVAIVSTGSNPHNGTTTMHQDPYTDMGLV